MTAESIALDGRPLGRRGLQTRRRFLDATSSLLETSGIRDLRVVEIARDVGTSPATFYQYFRDVEDAVLALAEDVAEDLVPITQMLAEPWTTTSARRMIELFVASWDTHRGVLRTRNLAALKKGLELDEILPISAKTGAGIDSMMDAIIEQLPQPTSNPAGETKALVFDSKYDDKHQTHN